MSAYKYSLEPYGGIKTRYTCPKCGKKQVFTRYIDTEANQYVADTVGLCNRNINCGYHYSPKQYFNDNNCRNYVAKPVTKSFVKPSSIISNVESTIPTEIFKNSLQSYAKNNFVCYLQNLFGYSIASQLVGKYFIGTSEHWAGATMFWQINISGNIRTGKIMLYSSLTGKRVKQPFNHITWVHSIIKSPNFRLNQCFFGEHLLNIDLMKPVGVVESEKTAVIASVFLPELIWIATGSLTNLTFEKCQVLKDRNVILFPDLKCLDKWKRKAIELSSIARFSVSELLENNATEIQKEHGLDLADFLINEEHQQQILREELKAEFLKTESIPIQLQWPVVNSYLNKGLKVAGVKWVINELINKYGFEFE